MMSNSNKNKIENIKTKKSMIIGLSLIFFGSLIYLFFGHGVEGQATFRLSRPTDPFALPNLTINDSVKSLFDFSFEDIHLEDYQHHSAILAPVAV